MFNIKNVSLVYRQENSQVHALNQINFTIETGQSWVFIGPSGCGKSSLLFLLAGLRQPTSGQIIVAGKPLNAPRAHTALILQDYGLFPWKSVWENVTLGLGIKGVSKAQQRSIVTPILTDLGLADYKDQYPAQLSGGQKQRVAVARALATSPDVLLMDEPFSSLDALTRENLQEIILDVWQQTKITLVTVTHNIEEAVYLGQKIAIFSPRPAQVVSILENPRAGDRSYRDHPDFYQTCALIRKQLEEVTRC